MNISDDVVVCMYFGRMAASHGPLLVARSIPYVNRETSKVLFLFVGGGDEKERVINYVNSLRLSNVLFLSEMPSKDILPIADVLIDNVSRLYDGYGITILEAMASGIPVITGRDSIKERVFTEGKEVIFCRKDDPEDIAQKILPLVFDSKKRKELSINGRSRVVSDHSVERHMELLERILASV